MTRNETDQLLLSRSAVAHCFTGVVLRIYDIHKPEQITIHNHGTLRENRKSDRYFRPNCITRAPNIPEAHIIPLMKGQLYALCKQHSLQGRAWPGRGQLSITCGYWVLAYSPPPRTIGLYIFMPAKDTLDMSLFMQNANHFYCFKMIYKLRNSIQEIQFWHHFFF